MRTLSLLVALVVAAPALGFVAFEEEKNLDSAKCPVSGKAVNPEAKLDYKGASVYFCCQNCPVAFQKDTAKFAEKANAQLVATGQAAQLCCPLSGRPVDETKATEVSGAKVTFCCANCLGKIEGSEEAEQLTLIFSEEAFKKAFEVKESEEK